MTLVLPRLPRVPHCILCGRRVSVAAARERLPDGRVIATCYRHLRGRGA
jgi:hypothetical protein